MKRILIALLLSVVYLGVSAQVTAKTYGTKTITPTAFSFTMGGTDGDSIGLVQDTLVIPIQFNLADSVKAFYRVKITEVTSPARIILQHQSKKHNLDTYTTRTTITYTGVGADSTMYFKSQAPNLSDPYHRILLIRSANKAKLTDASGWFLK